MMNSHLKNPKTPKYYCSIVLYNFTHTTAFYPEVSAGKWYAHRDVSYITCQLLDWQDADFDKNRCLFESPVSPCVLYWKLQVQVHSCFL